MRSAVQRYLLVTVVVSAAWMLPAPVVAQDDDVLDRTPQDCVTVARIRSTEVIDDKTILFYMRGGRVYQNILDRECPRLEREGRFMYEIRGYRLCDIDMITVLDRLGAGFSRGFTCRLGEFHPITRQEAEEIERIAEGEVEQEGVIEIEEVELPPEDSEEEQAVSE